MLTPEELLYSESHEWLKILDDGTALIGITDYAQDELGDIVFVNLPMEGDSVTAGEAFGDVESVKAVSDVICPVDGTVVAANEELMDAPQLINENPYDAWFIKVENFSGDDQLMSAAEYEAFVASQEE